MYAYQSETTKLLQEFLKNHPEEQENRLKNRALLWDVELNPEEQKAFSKAHIMRGAYAYQSK